MLILILVASDDIKINDYVTGAALIATIIAAVVVTATVVILCLVRKKHKLNKKIKVLETENPEACLRYVHMQVSTAIVYTYHNSCLCDIRHVPTPRNQSILSQSSINTEGKYVCIIHDRKLSTWLMS